MERTPVTFIHLVAQGADARRIADAAVSTWQAISIALSPIIGPRGVHGLYNRSMHLTRPAYPWLETLNDDLLERGQFSDLHAALIQQTSIDAAAANDALLQTFHNLLISLIGSSLSERLLQSVWDNFASGTAVEDSSP